MKKLSALFLGLIFLAAACSVAPKDTPIDTSAAAQARFKAEWFTNMRSKIFKGTYSPSKPGGISSPIYWAITADGTLADAFVTPFDANDWFWVPFHTILAYKSGTQVVVGYKFPTHDDWTYNDATDAAKAQIHVVELKGDKLYRTAYGGFTNFGAWDKSSYTSDNLVEFGVLDDNTTSYPKNLGIFADGNDFPGTREPFDPKTL